jgi:hypothetical protein
MLNPWNGQILKLGEVPFIARHFFNTLNPIYRKAYKLPEIKNKDGYCSL